MADLNPVVCTALVTNGSDEIEVTGTDAATGEAVVLSDLNCRPGATVLLAGAGYVVRQRLTTTTFQVWGDGYEGETDTDPGVSCVIQPFTPEMASRVELSQQLRDYSARLALLDSRGHGLLYQASGTVGLANPGPGKLGRDHADWGSVTNLCLSALDASRANVSQAARIDLWRAGTLVVAGSLATGGYHLYELTAVPESKDAGAWYQLAAPIYRGFAGAVADGEDIRVVEVIEGLQGPGYDYDAEAADSSGLGDFEEEDAGYKVWLDDLGTDFGAEYDGRSGVVELVEGPAWELRAVYTGPPGAQGDKGWTPMHAEEADGARLVRKLVGYIGGEGDAPTDNVGQYLKADGTYTATIGEGQDVRGPQGPTGLDGAGIFMRVHGVDTTDSDPATSGYTNGASLGGRTAGTGEVYLRAASGHPERNGLWVIAASGGASRHSSFGTFDSMPGVAASVMDGTYADTIWRCSSIQGGTLDTDPVVFERLGIRDYPRGHLFGLTLSNNSTDATNDIDISEGSCRDLSDTVNIDLAAALTKRLDADWAAGTGQGGRYKGAAIANGTYHVFAVAKAAGADPDIYLYPDPANGTNANSSAFAATVLAALQAETGGSDYLYVRRIGSIMRESGAIAGFVQVGDVFMRKVPVGITPATSTGTAAVSRVLAGVPTGIAVDVTLTISIVDATNTGGFFSLFTALFQTDAEPSDSIYHLLNQNAGGGVSISSAIMALTTNTAAQVRTRLGASAADISLRMISHSWRDRRGREA